MLEGSYKAAKGLIKVKAEVKSGHLSEIHISGDFFMHPEEQLNNLESALKGSPIEENMLKKGVLDFFKSTGCILVGVTPESFIHVIKMSLESQ